MKTRLLVSLLFVTALAAFGQDISPPAITGANWNGQAQMVNRRPENASK